MFIAAVDYCVEVIGTQYQNDRFGVGYYYLGTSDEIGVFLQGALGTIGDGQGAELFYNYEVTPWCHLTGNMQVLVPEVEDVDTALLIGLRAKIDF
ncbi:MAG: carbohydrate porin [Pirellulaceae bacterium]